MADDDNQRTKYKQVYLNSNFNQEFQYVLLFFTIFKISVIAIGMHNCMYIYKYNCETKSLLICYLPLLHGHYNGQTFILLASPL